MYNFLKDSGSLYREIVGTQFYDNHWDEVLIQISSSNWPTYSSSIQITSADEWMRASGSNYFNNEVQF